MTATSSSSDSALTAAPTTAADLLALAARHDLHLLADDAYVDTTGLDFLVVHARDAAGTWWIVRTPRRPDVYASSQVEARVLALVGPRLPVAVPEWRVHSPELIAYPRIVGTPAITVTPAGPSWNIIDPAALAPGFLASFARALAALQAIAPEDARAAGVPTVDIATTRTKLAESMAATRDVLQVPESVWARWQRWIAADDTWPPAVALVHGDLHPGHMLLAADARLIGVLDWTEAQVTDPAIDLAMFFGCFGRDALTELVTHFTAAGGSTWPRLIEHTIELWAAFPAKAAEWALRTDNTGILEHARGMIAATAAES